MKITKYEEPEKENIIRQAVQALLNEELVIMPTDTVYGVMALATSDKAVERLYKAKKRDAKKPTALLLSSTENAKKFIGNGLVDKLGKLFWPGPLTIVKEAKVKIAGFSKLGIRVPNEPFLLDVLEEVGQPVMASSANIAGENPPSSVSEISKELAEHVSLAVDNGHTKLSAASTVIEIENSNFKILRPGPVTEDQIERSIKH